MGSPASSSRESLHLPREKMLRALDGKAPGRSWPIPLTTRVCGGLLMMEWGVGFPLGNIMRQLIDY